MTGHGERSAPGAARLIGAGLGCLALAALTPWVLARVVALLHAGRPQFLSGVVFRSRDRLDVAFYLDLTSGLRVAASLTLLLVGAILVVSGAARTSGRVGSSAAALVRRSAAVTAWVPSTPLGQGVAAAALGPVVALAAGYRAIPGLGNDVVTYAVVARRVIDPTFLAGDLPVRDPDAAMRAWGALVGLLDGLFGFEGALFAVSLLGAAVLTFAVHRLATVAVAAGPAAGLIAAALATTLTFGSFGYELSVPSHANFSPTPRFVAIALAVLAIAFVLEGALVRGVAVGLMATAINTLDGLIPVGLALLALLLAGGRTSTGDPADGPAPDRDRGRASRWAASGALVAASVLALVAASGRALGLVERGWLPGPFVIVVAGTVSVLVLWALIRRPAFPDLPRSARLIAAAAVIAAGGVVLAGRRAATGASGFWERVTAFETVFRGVRQAPDMLVLSATGTASAVAFMALALLAVGIAAAERALPPSAEGDRRWELATLAVLTAAFVGVGGVLMERTDVPLVVTLWPIRSAWIVLLVAVVLGSALLGRVSGRLGFVPALGVALLLIEPPFGARTSWSVLLLLVTAVVATAHASGRGRTRRALPPAGVRHQDGGRRSSVMGTAVALAVPVIVVGLVAGISAPELRIADSMDRLEASASEANREVVQMARLARTLPPDARVLIPPDPRWGSFRIMSERGVAFEWKQFSTSQPELWYSQLRLMCDPDYLLAPDETFVIGGDAVSACHAAADLDQVLAIARRFEATHAVVRTALVDSGDRLGTTDSGRLTLIPVPTAER